MLKKFSNTIPAALGAVVGIAICATTATAVPVEVNFGSDNDGLGGFTQSTPGDATETWTTNAGSVQYSSTNTGTRNSSFLRSIPLSRTPGSSYTMTGVVTMTNGYADDNNRVGMYLFGDSAEVPNEDELGAIGLIFNTDDTSTGGSPGSNNPDAINLRVGIDANPNYTGDTLRTQDNTPYAQDLIGTQVTFMAEFAFRTAAAGDPYFDALPDGSNNAVTLNAAGGELLVDVVGSLTEADGTVTTTSMITLLASDFTGDYFGFVTRARARNYVDGVEGTPEGRSLPWVMDYNSFSIVPEPASLALLGLGGLMLLRRRR